MSQGRWLASRVQEDGESSSPQEPPEGSTAQLTP